MTVRAITHQNNSVMDLLANKPTAVEPRGSIDRPDAARQDREGGFDQVLRESSSPKRPSREAEPVSARDKQVTSDNDAVPNPPQDTSAARESSSAQDASHRESDANAQQGEVTEANPDTPSPSGEASQSDLVQAEVVAEAQAQAAASVAPLQSSVQDQAADPSAQAAAQGLAQASASSAKQQAQAALQHAHQQPQAQAAALSNNAPTQALTASAAQPVLAQDTPTDAGDDDADSATTSNAQATAATKTAGNTGATSAAFAVPDQPSGESRLPVNASAGAQNIESMKAVQVQSTQQQDDNEAVNTARLTRGLANAVQQRGGSVTLRLTPPEMGTVRIQMQVTGTNVSATFHAESATAQTLLTQQLSQLRHALESQGMQVDKLSVQPLAPAAHSQNASQNQNDQQQQQSQSQQQSANDGRSRGQYSGDGSGNRSSNGRGDGEAGRQSPRGFFDQLNDAGRPTAA